MVISYEAYKSVEDCDQLLSDLKIEKTPNPLKIERPDRKDANDIVKEFNFETGNDSIMFYKFCDALLLADIFISFV